MKSKDTSVILIVLLIFIIAAYLLYTEIGQKGLEFYLGNVTAKIIELVPDAEDKERIASLLGSFLSRIKNRTIEPDKVQHVAANLINIAALDSAVNYTVVVNAFNVAGISEDEILKPIIIERDSLTRFEKGFSRIEVTGTSEEEWHNLENRIREVMELNAELEKRIPESERSAHELQLFINENLSVDLNENVMKEIVSEKEKSLQEKIKILESQNRLYWKQNNPDIIKIRLDSLKNTIKITNFGSGQKTEPHSRLKGDSLKSIETVEK